jgi:hypothetical protein
MAPSVAEEVSNTVQLVQEKIAAKLPGKTETEPVQEAKVEPHSTAPVVLAPENSATVKDGPIIEPEAGKLPHDPNHLETGHKEPLKLSGALDAYESFDVTPVIGREFVNADLAEWLRAPNSDALLRDLAITISRRGVVFFRKQDGITDDLQKELVQRLGELSGKPATSKLHIHPVSNSGREQGGKDDEISVISSEQAKKIYTRDTFGAKKQSNKEQWHSDITFEPIPSDYALLRLVQIPKTGGGQPSP